MEPNDPFRRFCERIRRFDVERGEMQVASVGIEIFMCWCASRHWSAVMLCLHSELERVRPYCTGLAAKVSTSERATECMLAYVHRCVRWRVGIVEEEDSVIHTARANLRMFGIRAGVACRASHDM